MLRGSKTKHETSLKSGWEQKMVVIISSTIEGISCKQNSVFNTLRMVYRGQAIKDIEKY